MVYQALITNWTVDTDKNLVLSSYDNIAEADGYWTRYIKVTQNGSYIPGSGKYKAGNNAYSSIIHE